MANTVTGSSLETRTMDYFDALPQAARAALANARFDWACRRRVGRGLLGLPIAASYPHRSRNPHTAEAKGHEALSFQYPLHRRPAFPS